MACREVQQSAIQECRDQLFLDSADGIRLNVLTSNFGLDRPAIGTDDDEWRALAKVVALQPKQVRNIFYRLMEVCVGPQKTRAAYPTVDAALADTIVTVTNPNNLIQVGTLIFDPGLATEESVDFCFRDLVTGKVFLSTALLQPHVTVAEASNYLSATTSAAASSLVLVRSAEFPTTGFPYSVLLDEGTDAEEIVVVTANNTGTNTLTLLAPTEFDHVGPKATGFIRKPLVNTPIAGYMFLKLDANATRVFPATGFVRLNFGGGTEEVCEYVSNDVLTSVLWLKTPLAFAHSPGQSVELVAPGAPLHTAPVIQQGIAWHIHETEPRKVKICVPEEVLTRRLVDASFLHAITPSAASTTLTAAGLVGDTTLTVADTSTFRTGTGSLTAPGPVYVQYASIIDGTTFKLTFPLTAGISNGAAVSQTLVNYATTDLDEGNLRTALGAIEPEPQWSGPYVYDVTEHGVTRLRTTLATKIPPRAEVAVTQTVGRTCLEVLDVSLWPAPPFTAFTVRIGNATGFSEDRSCTDRTLRKGLSTTFSAPATAAVDTDIEVADASGFPASSDAVHPAGYRLLLASGTVREEIVRVNQNDEGVAPGIFTLSAPVTLNKNVADTVELLNDVLTFDILNQPHAAQTLSPTHPYPGNRPGHPVDILQTQLTVASGSGFATTGSLWLNFGKNRRDARLKIKSVISSTVLEFVDSSVFPTGNFPYQIIIGQGLPTQELAFVNANNTGTDRLTLSAAMVATFVAGDYVEFVAGDPLLIAYALKTSNTFTLVQPTIFESQYTIGESVIQSAGLSNPSNLGFDYPFRLPPAPITCVTNMLDLVRAAGVEVFVDNCTRTPGP